MTEMDVDKFRSMFQSMDKNGDGLLTVSEMRKALSAAGQDYTLKDIQKMVKKADKNGDGRVAWEEFLDMMIEQFQKMKGKESVKNVEGKEATGEEYSRAMEAFKIFDKNGDGIIDLDELQEAMQQLQIEQDSERVKQLLKDLDKNGDVCID